jgi:hypothetical protein
VRRDSEDRFCINCQHFVPTVVGDTAGDKLIGRMCDARKDPVTGETFLSECSEMRRPGMWCGGVGFLYVEKEKTT